MTFKLTELIVVCIKVIQGDTGIPVIFYGTYDIWVYLISMWKGDK